MKNNVLDKFPQTFRFYLLSDHYEVIRLLTMPREDVRSKDKAPIKGEPTIGIFISGKFKNVLCKDISNQECVRLPSLHGCGDIAQQISAVQTIKAHHRAEFEGTLILLNAPNMLIHFERVYAKSATIGTIVLHTDPNKGTMQGNVIGLRLHHEVPVVKACCEGDHFYLRFLERKWENQNVATVIIPCGGRDNILNVPANETKRYGDFTFFYNGKKVSHHLSGNSNSGC